MKSRSKIALTVVLLAFVVVSITYVLARDGSKEATSATQGLPQTTSATNETTTPTATKRTVAYYFHGNARCTSCLKIEAYSAEAIKAKFADQLKAGTLEWKVVNVEEPANSHFITDYQIVSKTVVLVQMDGNKQLRFKNLENVWNFLGNKDRFIDYVQTEVSDYLKGI
jgi:hypothetical protein